ncbi:MAG: Asp-tRNA(Asn)/Glu-tRNA(Gln) amidotransferase subunit GatC [Planctomycetota bacterium]|nr:Asp-tRNA(Asn)/Glu-tRNA(Gln) amidotransferase subunit GatC [Planctomycetota bacterium]
MGRSQARFSAEHTARLARIELSSEQADKVQGELEKLLAFVGRIDELELDDIDPFYGSGSTEDSTRPDVLQASSPRSEILRNAPQTDGEYFLVPPVFGQQESRED